MNAPRRAVDYAKWFRGGILAAATALLLGGGLWAANWRGQRADELMREVLLQQAEAIARTINLDRISALSFTTNDLSNPSYQRLCDQLAAFSQVGIKAHDSVFHYLNIYSMSLRNDDIVFGPESLDPADPMAAIPGTAYQQPPFSIQEGFHSAQAFTRGPYTDEYGSFISAFAPVIEPQSGQTILLIGLDVEAAAWARSLRRKHAEALLLTLLLTLLLWAGYAFLRSAFYQRLTRRVPLLSAEALLTLFCGLLITLTAAWKTHSIALKNRQSIFLQVANAQAGTVCKAWTNLRDFHLQEMVRYFESSEHVSREEFRKYAQTLARKTSVLGYGWAPVAPSNEQALYTAAAHADGLADFEFFEYSDQGQAVPAGPRPLYVPLFYVEPQEFIAKALGFDLGSDPIRKKALATAAATGLATASDPIALIRNAGSIQGLLVAAPLYVNPARLTLDPPPAPANTRREVQGFALAIASMERVLKEALSQAGSQAALLYVDVVQVEKDRPPLHLAASSPDHAELHDSVEDLLDDAKPILSTVYPLFAFGKTYAIVVHAAPLFLSKNPAREGVATGLAGILLTLLTAYISGQLAGRRRQLEEKIATRTRELNTSEERLRLAMEATSDGLWDWNLQTGQVYWSPRTYTMLGYEPDEFPVDFAKWQSLIHPDDRERAARQVQENIQAGDGSFSTEFRCLTKNGEWKWIAGRGKAVERDPAGNLLRVVGTHVDITDRKQAEEALQAQTQFLHQLIEAMPSPVFFKDMQGRYQGCNAAFLNYIGLTREYLIGKTVYDIAPPELAAVYDKKDRELLERMGRQTYEGQVRYADGTLHDVVFNKATFVDAQGNTAGLVGVMLDITERKKSEQEIQQANTELADRAREMERSQKTILSIMEDSEEARSQLEDTNRQLESAIQRAQDMALAAEAATQAKSEFLANMSHEIRTPMNGVIGMAELLLDTPLETGQKDRVEIILRSAQALLSILNDILDFSKLEAGKIVIQPAPFNLLSVIEEVAQLLAVQAESKGVDLIVYYDTTAPQEWVGDAGRIRQVLTNLASNAVKFSEQGHVLMTAQVVEQDGGQALLEIAVEDSGIGIAPEDLPLLFQKFSQIDASSTRTFQGSGLGLAISKQLVEMMGGVIQVESRQGYGSRFFFRLNLPRPSAIRTEQKTAPLLAGLRILLVDGNPSARKIMGDMLRQAGADCSVAETARDALQILRQAAQAGTPFPLMLLEDHLPDGSGEEAARQIAGDPELSSTRVLLMLRMGRRHEILQEAMGITACLIKPIRPSHLAKAIHAAWKNPKAGGMEAPDSTPVPTGSPPGAFPGMRILLVEDNQVNQMVARGLLESLQCQVTIAPNGRDAVEQVQHHEYDLVFMDCAMPVMDGYEATQSIREWEQGLEAGHKRLTIVAMTARAMADDRAQCLAAGMDDFISKPINKTVLIEALQRHLAPGHELSPIAPVPPAALPAGPPLLNTEQPLSFGREHPALLKEVIEIFLRESPQQLEQLRQAVAEGHDDHIYRIAHTLKGAALNLGGELLAHCARQIENKGKKGAPAGLEQDLQRLEEVYARFAEKLREEDWRKGA